MILPELNQLSWQVIAFLYSAMRSVDLGLKTAVIVTPVTVLHNWRSEFLKWSPSELKPLRVFMLGDVSRFGFIIFFSDVFVLFHSAISGVKLSKSNHSLWSVSNPPAHTPFIGDYTVTIIVCQCDLFGSTIKFKKVVSRVTFSEPKLGGHSPTCLEQHVWNPSPFVSYCFFSPRGRHASDLGGTSFHPWTNNILEI